MATDVNGAAELDHLIGAAKDALSDDIVTRVAETAAHGMDLIDEVHRSGIKRALPAIADLVENGDLDRLVKLARVYGSAEDALSDDIIGRVSEALSDGMVALDRFNRGGGRRLIDLLERMEASGTLEKLADGLPRLIDRLDQVERMLVAVDVAESESARGVRAKGGVGGIVSLLTNAENQEALRHLINLGKALGSTKTT
ncbi:MAG: hypothetical protein AB7V46_15930 [Thermomicrobiales bacterium]